MDLRTKKYIHNTKSLPCFVLGEQNIDTSKLTGFEKFKSRWNNGGGEKAMGAAIQGLDAMQQFNSMKYPTNYANDFVGKYGYTEGNIDGFKFQQYKDIDTNVEENRMSQIRDSKIMSGATTGAITGLGLGLGATALIPALASPFTAPIALLGGLLGGGFLGGLLGNSAKNEEEEQMRIAQIKQNNANEQWRTNALSASLRNKALERYGDTSRFNLYSSALGSENVHTSKGVKPGEPNAKVDNGEIIEGKDGSAHQVIGNPYITDGEYAKLHNGDNIYSNKLTVPGTNITYAQAYPTMKALGREKELLALQPISREMKKKSTNKGELLHAWNGLENLLITIPGMVQSWRDYKEAVTDDIDYSRPNPFNKYEGVVNQIMGGLRISPYTHLRSIANKEASQRYSINKSGGLSAMQKTMANIANSMNSRIATANALFDINKQNLEYAKDNANMKYNMGNVLMDAGIKDWQLSKQNTAASKAAQRDMLNKSKYSMLNYLGQGIKNMQDLSMYKKIYGLYATQQANENAKTQAIINSLQQNQDGTNIQNYPIYGSDDWWNMMRRSAEISKKRGVV